ncbi:hypothetical protein TKK_0015618 [Trichogramma kaykai]
MKKLKIRKFSDLKFFYHFAPPPCPTSPSLSESPEVELQCLLTYFDIWPGIAYLQYLELTVRATPRPLPPQITADAATQTDAPPPSPRSPTDADFTAARVIPPAVRSLVILVHPPSLPPASPGQSALLKTGNTPTTSPRSPPPKRDAASKPRSSHRDHPRVVLNSKHSQ